MPDPPVHEHWGDRMSNTQDTEKGILILKEDSCSFLQKWRQGRSRLLGELYVLEHSNEMLSTTAGDLGATALGNF